ncbi:ParB/RepB/Spo0J family partition protein [Laribacter hongkongensis]|uniref:ParB/RepB/Spo0J family partition protein n=1 Tax=Laribacter hongkongensis TaxID=168471 RepID=UPI001EFE264B|nr:ParB/RepB/Spo0J family partition protein [Laribacter hongkongensis]MCG9060088.1 ParB/RepB/Spo0J family partition protein [Laribacter hongkongensis]MCG9084093.1 ParB/RepB/Spo0J family partition protein [Laribacter hongkongensis]MCG9087159.1 ParB/RepB/Spo0J family partition protein [Laribacter hongkongensis]
MSNKPITPPDPAAEAAEREREKARNWTQQRAAERQQRSTPTLLSPQLIDDNEYQSRKFMDEDALLELAESIKVQGLLQPIAVRRSNQPGRYILVAGSRRLAASKLIDMPEIPVHVVDMSQASAALATIVENEIRENTTLYETAMAMCRYMEDFHGRALTIPELAAKASVSEWRARSWLQFIALPDALREEIRALGNRFSAKDCQLFSALVNDGVDLSWLLDALSQIQSGADKKGVYDNLRNLVADGRAMTSKTPSLEEAQIEPAAPDTQKTRQSESPVTRPKRQQRSLVVNGTKMRMSVSGTVLKIEATEEISNLAFEVIRSEAALARFHAWLKSEQEGSPS